MAEDLAEDGVAVASWPSKRSIRPRRRVSRRKLIPPLIVVGLLALAHFLFGAAEPMSALFLSVCFAATALVSLLTAGPRYVTFGMLAGAAAIWLFGALGWAGPLERAAPGLAVLFAAGCIWVCAYLCARQRSALDVAWAGLVWTSFAYCGFMFFRHIAASFAGTDESGSLEGAFATPADGALMFGVMALIGSARVCHVLKQIDAEAASRSEGVEKLLSDGLGGLLLLGFAMTCLALTGSRDGLFICGGVLVLHAWWDTRTLVRRAERGVARRVIGRITPWLALVIIGWGVALAYMYDTSLSGDAVGAAPYARLQRLDVYFDAFMKRPLFGYGVGSAEAVRNQAMTLSNARALLAPGLAQNVGVTWLVEVGATGTAALLAVLGAIHLGLFRGLSIKHAPRTFLRLALTASLLIALHGATNSSVNLPSLIWTYAFLLGAGCGVAGWRNRSRSGAEDGAE